MSLAELLPAVRSLPHPEKLRLLQFLAGELVREDPAAALRPGMEVPIWSPFDSFAAAQTLEQVLQADEGRP